VGTPSQFRSFIPLLFDFGKSFVFSACLHLLPILKAARVDEAYENLPNFAPRWHYFSVANATSLLEMPNIVS